MPGTPVALGHAAGTLQVPTEGGWPWNAWLQVKAYPPSSESCLRSAAAFLLALFVASRRRRRTAAALALAATANLAARPIWEGLVRFAKAAKLVVIQQVSDVLVGVVGQLTKEDDRHMNSLLQIMGGAIRTASKNEDLKAALKEAVIEAMRFEQLHNEMVGTLTGAMVAASRDKGLRAALLGIITESLKDEGFMSEMMATMTEATVSAAKNRDLMDSCLQVVKIAITDVMRDAGFVADVSGTITQAGMSVIRNDIIRDSMVNVGKLAIVEALRDEAFLSVIRETLADSLRDGNIYRGAAAGVVGALNPFGRRRPRDPDSVSVQSSARSEASSVASEQDI